MASARARKADQQTVSYSEIKKYYHGAFVDAMRETETTFERQMLARLGRRFLNRLQESAKRQKTTPLALAKKHFDKLHPKKV